MTREAFRHTVLQGTALLQKRQLLTAVPYHMVCFSGLGSMSAGKMQTKVQPEKEKQLSADWINREPAGSYEIFFS